MYYVLNTEGARDHILKNNPLTELQFCRSKGITFFLPYSRRWHSVKLMGSKMKTQGRQKHYCTWQTIRLWSSPFHEIKKVACFHGVDNFMSKIAHTAIVTMTAKFWEDWDCSKDQKGKLSCTWQLSLSCSLFPCMSFHNHEKMATSVKLFLGSECPCWNHENHCKSGKQDSHRNHWKHARGRSIRC